MSAPWRLEKKAHGGVKDLRAQPSLVWLQQEGFLRPPLLSSIPGPTSNRKVWRDCFSFQRAVCPGPRLVCPACPCPCSGYRETTVWLSCFLCEYSAQLSVFLACFCVLGVDLQSMTLEHQCPASCAKYSEFVTVSRATDRPLFCELHDQFGLIKNEVGKWECLRRHQRVLLGQRAAARQTQPRLLPSKGRPRVTTRPCPQHFPECPLASWCHPHPVSLPRATSATSPMSALRGTL